MLKAKYVATIEVNISIPEETPNVRPFEEIKCLICGEGITKAIQETLDEEFFEEFGRVTVTPQYQDCVIIDKNRQKGAESEAEHGRSD